jgi:hypothetical protein
VLFYVVSSVLVEAHLRCTRLVNSATHLYVQVASYY